MTPTIKQLTKEQALQVVNYIRDNVNANEDVSFEDNGSSRAVFQVEIGSSTYVVKMAGDMQGRKQNQIEMNLWENAGDQGFLAAIRYAYKDIFIICDFVHIFPCDLGELTYGNPVDYFWEKVVEYGYCDYLGLDEDASEEDIEDIYEEINNTISSLEYYQGVTYDNYQIGIGANEYNNRSTNYSIVAYDYGYSTEIDREEQVGYVEGVIHYGDYAKSELFNIELGWIENDVEYSNEYTDEDKEEEVFEWYMKNL